MQDFQVTLKFMWESKHFHKCFTIIFLCNEVDKTTLNCSSNFEKCGPFQHI